LEKTLRNRPDLLERVALTAEDEELLVQIKLDQIKLDQIKRDQDILRDGASPVSTKD
jgi:hypothetical protein